VICASHLTTEARETISTGTLVSAIAQMKVKSTIAPPPPPFLSRFRPQLEPSPPPVSFIQIAFQRKKKGNVLLLLHIIEGGGGNCVGALFEPHVEIFLMPYLSYRIVSSMKPRKAHRTTDFQPLGDHLRHVGQPAAQINKSRHRHYSWTVYIVYDSVWCMCSFPTVHTHGSFVSSMSLRQGREQPN
jgi:hypothetical protein